MEHTDEVLRNRGETTLEATENNDTQWLTECGFQRSPCGSNVFRRVIP